MLALLALLFLLRCLLDPVDNAYYHVPFLLSLMAWEGLVRRGLPLVSILSSVTIYYAIYKAGWTDDLALRNASTWRPRCPWRRGWRSGSTCRGAPRAGASPGGAGIGRPAPAAAGPSR